MLISVIIPVYQVESYLRECVESVLSQTYSDWELWLVDDGSTDRSGEICDCYHAHDKRINVIHLNGNSGPAAARNAGLSACKGDYVVFVDADDWMEPDTLSSINEIVRIYDADIVHFSYMEERDGKSIHRGSDNRKVEIIDRDKALLDVFTNKIPSYLWMNAFRRTLIVEKIPDIKVFEDHAVFFMWVSHCSVFAHYHKMLYHYRMNPQSILHNPDVELCACLLKALELRVDYIARNNLLVGMEDVVDIYYRKNLIKVAKDMVRTALDINDVQPYLQTISDRLRENKCNMSSFTIKERFRIFLLLNNPYWFVQITRKIRTK